MKLPYEEFNLAGIKTYPLRSRQSKVSLAQFGTPYKAGSGVQGLLKSLPSLLMLVAAFAGRDTILAAYREAVAERYRFYSYGDATVIL